MREKVAGNEEYEVNGETYQYGAAAYRLEDSITLSQTSWSSITGIRSGFILDGQGYTISGLEGDSFINLVAEGAVIRNLTVDGEIRNGSGYAILTIQNSGTIENCQVTGSIAGSGAAGLVSDNYGTIKGCTSDVNIEASNGAGGIAAFAYGEISGCSNTGTIINDDINYGHAAGIAGLLSDSTISGCSNTGRITSPSNTGGIAGYAEYCVVTASSNTGEIIGSGGNIKYAGGIAGQLGYFYDVCQLEDCYNRGEISGGANAGGICGFISAGHGNIQNCYSTGRVQASSSSSVDAAGICGNGVYSSLTGCYALNESVTSSDGSATSVARVRRWDANQLSDNYGWDQMLLNGQTATGGTAENTNGADVTTEALTDSENTAGLWGNYSDAVWTKENGRLPVLTNAVGEQDSQLPDYIINGPTEPAGETGLTGEGTKESPNLIVTAEDWQFAADKMNSYDSDAASYRSAWYSLENDLSLVTVAEPAAGNSSRSSFQGHFNGNNHTVQISLSGTTVANGFFGYIGADGVVENLTVSGTVISSRTMNSNVGMIAGENAGIIRNCHVSGTIVKNTNAQWSGGGLAGRNSGTIERCSVRADISGGYQYVGGIAGQNSGIIRNSYSQGSLNIGLSSSSYSNTYGGGGIAGQQSDTNAETSYCYSTMNVTAEHGGGIVGYLYGGSVHNCAAMSETVSGEQTSRNCLESGGRLPACAGRHRSRWHDTGLSAVRCSVWSGTEGRGNCRVAL